MLNIRIEVIENISGFSRIVYRFWLTSEKVFILDYYANQYRATKRHQFKALEWYDRLAHRDSKVLRETIHIPKSVKQEVMTELVSMITVED